MDEWIEKSEELSAEIFPLLNLNFIPDHFVTVSICTCYVGIISVIVGPGRSNIYVRYVFVYVCVCFRSKSLDLLALKLILFSNYCVGISSALCCLFEDKVSSYLQIHLILSIIVVTTNRFYSSTKSRNNVLHFIHAFQ